MPGSGEIQPNVNISGEEGNDWKDALNRIHLSSFMSREETPENKNLSTAGQENDDRLSNGPHLDSLVEVLSK